MPLALGRKVLAEEVPECKANPSGAHSWVHHLRLPGGETGPSCREASIRSLARLGGRLCPENGGPLDQGDPMGVAVVDGAVRSVRLMKASSVAGHGAPHKGASRESVKAGAVPARREPAGRVVLVVRGCHCSIHEERARWVHRLTCETSSPETVESAAWRRSDWATQRLVVPQKNSSRTGLPLGTGNEQGALPDRQGLSEAAVGFELVTMGAFGYNRDLCSEKNMLDKTGRLGRLGIRVTFTLAARRHGVVRPSGIR